MEYGGVLFITSPGFTLLSLPAEAYASATAGRLHAKRIFKYQISNFKIVNRKSQIVNQIVNPTSYILHLLFTAFLHTAHLHRSAPQQGIHLSSI